jgi:hypothetical protein
MSFTDAKRFETMRAEMQPDLYGGEHFPPGTVVSVLEPECETCGKVREPRFDRQRLVGFASECECGFNWDEWVEQRYS